MNLIKQTGNNTLAKDVLSARESKAYFSDKCFLILREDNMPYLIKPVRLMSTQVCALTGRKIQQGEMAYKCKADPFVFHPAGRLYVHWEEALSNLDRLMPDFYVEIPSVRSLFAKQQTEVKRLIVTGEKGK